jgi:hypothetical protein
MEYSLLQKFIPDILTGEIYINDLKKKYLLSNSKLLNFIKFLQINRIGEIKKDVIILNLDDQFRSITLALRFRTSIHDMVKNLNWKDFEKISSVIFDYCNYKVYLDFRIRKPTIQIDLIAIKSRTCLLVDCKHWKHNLGFSNLIKIVNRQNKRTEIFMSSNYPQKFDISNAIPMILTFLDEKIKFVSGIPIVNIGMLSNFLLEIDGYSNIFKRIYKKIS